MDFKSSKNSWIIWIFFWFFEFFGEGCTKIFLSEQPLEKNGVDDAILVRFVLFGRAIGCGK